MEPSREPGVFREGRDLFTVNATPGRRVYGETLRLVDGVEYRAWDPFRSKLAALIVRGGAPGDLFEVPRGALYLGGAHGTTVSHLSDLWPRTPLFVVEKSPSSFVHLLELARSRSNIYPLFADAQLPERYQADAGAVEFLYQDVAQRNQAQIFAENARACLGRGGRGVLMLKVRSVTQRGTSASVVRAARRVLEGAGMAVRSETPLVPFSRDHVALSVRY